MKPTLLILAAGIGSRYGGLKQIDSVGPSGEIILDYSVYDAIKAGFGKVVFIIRKSIEAEFKEVIGNKYKDKIAIDYAYQELDMLPEEFRMPEDREKPWGTGHAVICAEQNIREPFAVINADDFYGANSFQELANYLSSIENIERNDYCMVGYTLRNTLSDYGSVARGICSKTKDDFLSEVIERTKIEKIGKAARYLDDDGHWAPLTGNEIVSLNFWGFTPTIFAFLKRSFKLFLKENAHNIKAEFFLPTVVNELIQKNEARVKILQTTDSWFGITYKKDKPIVVANIQKLIDKNVYPSKLF